MPIIARTHGEALIRWEYDKSIVPRCRNHVQFHKGAKLVAADHEWDLNRLHTPTGWVLIEDVIRFVITELDVQPPCGYPDCFKRLDESERVFHADLSGKRYKPPADT